ncbi:restriction endonuclease subunit S [Providencia rettgeri]|nr:restriction endonuclease subunit S [Providencia rettgeri]MDT5429907.1 restriction endonuclease subunit S [Providencia rettgeri]
MSNRIPEKDLNLIPAGYKQTEVGVIPEDWKCYSFGDLVDYKKGYAFKSDEYGKTGIRIIRVSDTSYSGIKDDSPIFISDKLAKLYHAWSIKEGDLIFSTVGSKPPMYDSLVGKAIYVTKKYEGSLLNQNAVRIRAKSKTEGIQSLLLNHFRTERYIDFIELIFRGNANQASITLENLFEFKIPLPRLEKEQTAIANALSDVDALISELEKLIAKKQAIKTATMQQLLTGRTRLPQFALREDGTPKGTKPSELGEIPEDWEVYRFEQNFTIYAGGDVPKDSFSRIKTDAYPYPIFANAIQGRGLYGYTSHKRSKPDSVTITARGYLGHAEYRNEPFFPIVRLLVMEPVGTVDSRFATYAINELVEFPSESTGVPQLTASQVGKFSISAPADVNEQTAIATILSDMDAEIQALEQRLGKTRQIKQGMMQELLTGKTRLPYDKE